MYSFILLVLFLLIFFYSYNIKYNIIFFKEYINDCNNSKFYNTKFIAFNKTNPYLSICLPAYNMEKYITKSLLSIINQSFHDFEIIIVNDNSNDDTEKTIQFLQSKDKRIRIIKHFKNLGVYCSRINAALNAKSEFVIFMDPDDMFLNPHLFAELYNYNNKYNLDMIEFSVYHQKEGKKKIYFPIYHELNHYHNFKEVFIYQPELSNLIFYNPNKKSYSSIICRTIWNKMIRKSILINSIKYMELSFHNTFLIAADDTSINILNFNYARNYSNIKLPGYLYNIRKDSMSRIDVGNKHDLSVGYNYLLYFEFFYKYIKDFKKDLNFLFYELKLTYSFLLKFKELNATNYILKTNEFFNEIINDDISMNFKIFIKKIFFELNN
jgi:glycosyltransferase involved in cell wall biosynthesis